MGKLLFRLLLPLPVLLTLAAPEAKAQRPGVGFGVGIGYGFPGFGPGYGYGPGLGYGPGFGYGYPGFYPGVFPLQQYGNYGNGLSMYGPPVPTYKPVPGMFGGADSTFFPPPPAYRPGFYNFAYIPLNQPAPILSPAPLPVAVAGAEELPPPLEVLTKTAPLEVEVHMPAADAQLFIDGQVSATTGAVRLFKSPPLNATDSHTYEVKAVWVTAEGKVSHTKKVTGRAGEKVKVEFTE